jgi:two-component system response regulator YesN
MGTQCTLCVIDDVVSVVQGISKHIPWEQYGIEVIGTALDGEEGLQLIHRLRPDIVLTDIRMPNMDGIEMLTELRQSSFEGKIIFFSGYNDFDYAQQALRLGAYDYITKPHSVEQIVEVILKAKAAIEAKALEDRHSLELRNKLKESLPILRQEFFSLLLHHRTNEDNIRNRWEFLQLTLPREDLTVLVFEIDQLTEKSIDLSIEEVELIRFSLQNIVEETISSYTQGVIFRDTMSRFAAIYHNQGELELTLIADKCCEHIAAYTKFTVTIGQGRGVCYASELSEAYQEANLALSYQFYAGGNVVLTYGDVAGNDNKFPRYSKDDEHELAMSLRSGNVIRARESLTLIFDELSSGPTRPEPMSLMSVYYELAAQMLRILLEKVPYSDIQHLEQKLRDRHWSTLIPLKELQQLIIDLCEEGCLLTERRQRSMTASMVDKAISFIHEQLHTDITVGDCAKHVHLSPNYFVNVFKRETGRTFVQFVTQARIEKAKTLLLEGHQVQEIAAEVGYEDRRYFSDVFKKAEGMTPSEYTRRFSP